MKIANDESRKLVAQVDMPVSNRSKAKSEGPAHFGLFSTDVDLEACRQIHRRYGKTYYFATKRFPSPIRERVHALYAFVRVPDEWVDNPESGSREETAKQLASYRREFLLGLDGVVPDSPVLRAFCDVVRESEISPAEALLFLDAMNQDLTVRSYETYRDLQRYMRGSASAVGVMMCSAMAAETSDAREQSAIALGEAMQLTNFLRDIREDYDRGRIYVPQEDLRRFGVTDDTLRERKVTPQFVELMKFEMARARKLYEAADLGIDELPPYAQPAVSLARILYSRILDHIEARGYDVFNCRARTSRFEKLFVLAQVMARKGRINPFGGVAR